MKIFEALSAVMADVAPVGKGGVNEDQHYRFRKVDDLYDALRPALAKHGVVIVPNVSERVEDAVTTQRGNLMRHVVLTVQFQAIGPEGDAITWQTISEALDTSDKATNKALTAAWKYAMLQLFCVPLEGEEESDARTVEVPAVAKEVPPRAVSDPEKLSPTQAKVLRASFAKVPSEQRSDLRRALAEKLGYAATKSDNIRSSDFETALAIITAAQGGEDGD